MAAASTALHGSSRPSSTTRSSATADRGGAIYCILLPDDHQHDLAFNSSGIYKTDHGHARPLRYNCVYGNAATTTPGLADPTGTDGNISADPSLAGFAYGNVHIQPDSPCIDAGDDAVVQAGWPDMDGQAAHARQPTWTSGPTSPTAPSGQPGPTSSSASAPPATTPTTARPGPWPSGPSRPPSTPPRPRRRGLGRGGHVRRADHAADLRPRLRRLRRHRDRGPSGPRSGATSRSSTAARPAGVVVAPMDIGCGVSTIDGFTIRNGAWPASSAAGSAAAICLADDRQQHDHRQHHHRQLRLQRRDLLLLLLADDH